MKADAQGYIIRHCCPVDFRDMPALEGWLTDMAQTQGLFFERYRTATWMFTRREPKPARYRLEPVRGRRDRTPDPERVAYYRSCGWTYCGAIVDYYHVYLAMDPEVPELYDDPVSQSYALEALERRQRWNAFFYLSILLLYPLLLAGISCFASDWPLLSFLESASLTQVLITLTYLFTFLLALRSFLRVHRLRRQLRMGLPMEHRASPASIWTVRLNIGISAVLIVIAIISVFSSGRERWLGTTPDALMESGRLPAYISLEELEPAASVESVFVHYRQTPLLRSYDIEQDMDTLTTAEGQRYTPGLTYEFYDLTLPFLASPVLDELVYRYTQHHYFSDEFQTEALDLLGFDRAVLASYTDGFGQKLFLARGGQVLYVCYFGWGDLLAHMDSIEALFS